MKTTPVSLTHTVYFLSSTFSEEEFRRLALASGGFASKWYELSFSPFDGHKSIYTVRFARPDCLGFLNAKCFVGIAFSTELSQNTTWRNAAETIQYIETRWNLLNLLLDATWNGATKDNIVTRREYTAEWYRLYSSLTRLVPEWEKAITMLFDVAKEECRGIILRQGQRDYQPKGPRPLIDNAIDLNRALHALNDKMKQKIEAGDVHF